LSHTVASTVVILQPGYLPWLGFFDQMRRADIFVYYDDVQFDRRGWRNRNRIKLPGGPHWLTVPVRQRGQQLILDVEIDNDVPWAHKHLSTIRHFYAQAPYLKRYLPELEEMLGRPWRRIVELDIAVIQLMCDWLGLRCVSMRSSELNIKGERSQRLLDVCLRLGASRYLTGDAAKSYLDGELFARHNIEVQWHEYQHPVYPQQYGEFIPYLSALDLLLNCGERSAAILAGDEGGVKV
jgi:hypothetical protein